MSEDLPVVGAAMSVATLERLHNWVREKNRDLELQDFISSTVLDGDWMPVVERARTLLDGYDGRLGIHGPFWGFSIDTTDPAIRDVVGKRLDQGLDVCAALGGSHMVIHSPFTAWNARNALNHPGQMERQIEACRETLKGVVARAEDLGCTLVIENIDDTDPASRVALVRSLDSPAVAVSLDTGHAYYAHCTNGAPPPDDCVRQAGADLAHIHLQDADGHADRHWPLGEGAICWAPFFRAIAATGTDPRLILELADADRILDTAEWLEEEGLAA